MNQSSGSSITLPNWIFGVLISKKLLMFLLKMIVQKLRGNKMRPHFPFSNYLAGVSGGGKHRQHLELLCNIGQSILFSWKYGDHIGKELDIIRIINLPFERYDQQNQAFRMLDKVILSRGLLLIKVLTEKKISTPKEWLFIQLNTRSERS
ncbi:hypothetical protein RhiirC2_767785 [Rhizophagus irregularis]|uniref:Uncharacterized protein n=1 Tax=Rhizophagus irregularis TaxID=588596 RepID=A0A2N1P3P0_9GLOM|nr:hypothetical protein RhiirC2_767785 [Rhizophagus irregularis]